MKNIFLKTYIAALMLVIILSAACKKENLSGMRQTSFNTTFDLQLSEKILVTSVDRKLKVELRSLNDNRCTDALPCEHAGNATTRVFLSDPDNHIDAETNLCIGMCDEENKSTDTASVTLDGKKYNLVLNKIFGSLDKKAEFQINTN